MTANLRSRLLQLDAQIAEQSCLLNELQQTRSDVERELNATATFPVLTLPPEITTEIFIRLLDFSPSCIPGKQLGPIVLASVCRQWRDIALATPVLWSKLEVQFDDISPHLISTSGLVEGAVDQWLARAGNRPLSLDFECRDDFALNRLRNLIHRWSHRAQYFRVHIGYRDIRPLELESAMFPLLQEVVLGCDEDGPGLVLNSAPCFHNLRLLWAGISLSTTTLPWLQLTKFVGTELWNIDLFTLAPNLTEMTCTFDLNHEDSFPTITHCNLISLTTDHYADVLRYLTLPALRHLDLSMDDNNGFARDEDFPHPLESFLVRSSPPLVSLCLSFAESDEEAYDEDTYCLDQCMRLVGGSLQSLDFWKISNNLMPSIFDNLRPDSLPHIQKLGFKDIYGPLNLPIFIHLLHRFDTLRTAAFVWTSSPFLDRTITVHASTPAHCEDTIIGHLSRLAQKGMEIYLGTDEKNYLSIDEAK